MMTVLPAPIPAAAEPPARCPEERSEGFRTGPWAVLLMLILAGAAYVNTLGYQFVWDDWAMIAQNRHIRAPQSLPELVDSDFTALTGGGVSGGYYRPVLALSLALDAALWGARPAFFHLTNVLLHVLATFLLYRLVLALTASPGSAVIAGLFFGLHPVHVEAVAFVAARGDILLTIGILGCVLAYRGWNRAGARRGLFLLAALASAALALLAKESAVVLPALLILSDVAETRRLQGEAGASVWGRALRRSLPVMTLTAIAMISRLSTLATIGGDKLGLADLWARLPGSLEILARYVGLCLVPVHMQPYYSLTRPTSFLAPGPALGIATLAALGCLLIWCRHRLPLAAFGLGWFLIAVVPVVDLVPLSFREMGLTDRYLYLPSVGIAVFLAALTGALLTYGASSGLRAGRTIGWAVVVLVLAGYSWQLLRYLPVWHDNLSLYTRMEQVAPGSPNPPFNIALTYFRAGDPARATTAMERAVRLNPRLKRPRSVLGLLYVLQGRTSDGFRLLEGVGQEGSPDRDYYVGMTMAHLYVGEIDQALATGTEGIARYPEDPDLFEWLGRALERAGRPHEAIQAYGRALTLAPDQFTVEVALGNVLARERRQAEAVEHLQRAAEIRPDRPEPIRTLALLAEAEGHTTESLRLWQQVLEMAPNAAAIQEAASHIHRLKRVAPDEEAPAPGQAHADPGS